MTISIVFYVLALVFLILAAASVPTGRLSCGWLGMSLWLIGNLLAGAAVTLH